MSFKAQSLACFATVSLLAAGLAAGCVSSDDEVGRPHDNQGSTSSGSGGADGGFAPGAGGAGGTTSDGGEGGVGVHQCAETSSVASLDKLPADLIIAVDNSDSMALEASEVKALVNTMVGSITATGIDAHVIVISKGSNNTIFDLLETGVCLPAPVGSGNCPDDENLPSYRHVFEEVASNDALTKIIATYDDWKGSLRAEATKTFLVVTDDESAMSAQDFSTALSQLSPPITSFKFNAIAASSEGPISCGICAVMGCANCTNPCCNKSLACLPVSMERGQSYIDLQTQTSGVYGDLCTQSFAPIFADMATAVIEHTEIACSFDIPMPPQGTIIPDETNVDFTPVPSAQAQPIYNVASEQDCTINGGWYFDDNVSPTKIFLCPSTCTLVKPSTEGEVRVKFGCATENSPS